MAETAPHRVAEAPPRACVTAHMTEGGLQPPRPEHNPHLPQPEGAKAPAVKAATKPEPASAKASQSQEG